MDQDERGKDRKWADLGCFLKVVSRGLRDGLDVWYERNRGIKNDTKIFSLRSRKDDLHFIEMAKVFRRKRFEGNDKEFIWDTLSWRCLFDIRILMAIIKRGQN